MQIWIIILLMTVASVALCAWPLLRRPRTTVTAESGEIYKQLLKDIDADVRAGLLPESERDQARAEAGRRLLRAEREGQDKALSHKPAGPRIAAFILLGALLPVGAILTYAMSGAPRIPDQPLEARLSKPAHELTGPELVARVERQLRKSPEDARGWTLLAPVYARAGELGKAENAYRNALKYGGETPRLLGDLGEVIVARAEGVMVRQAADLFDRELALDPEAVRPLAYQALAFEQNDMQEEALERWNMVAGNPAAAGSVWEPVAKASVERLEIALGMRDAPPGPTREDMAAAQDMSAAEQRAMINSMVEGLAARLADDGGSAEDWGRLIRAYMVLDRKEDAEAALERAVAGLAENKDDLGRLLRMVKELGLEPDDS